MKEHLIILGIDHGTHITGYGLIDFNAITGEKKYLMNGLNRLEAEILYPKTVLAQTEWVDKFLDGLYREHDMHIDLVALEGSNDNRGFTATQRLQELQGCIKLVLMKHKQPYTVIPPSTMKKIITGNGFADKEIVARTLSELYSLPFDELVNFTYYKQGIKKGQVKSVLLDGSDALGLATAAPDYIKRVKELEYNGD